jgi:NAD(P)-dependent dehydrogenase (short-subunit alcohol dehydrogenase family)
MTNRPLSGKTALITGGAHRIGREIALELAAAGADICLTYRKSKTDADETTRLIQETGRRSIAIECDVRSEDSIRLAVTACLKSQNRLDLLINNAAIFESAPLDRLSLEQWDNIFATNTRGPFLVSREALPHLRTAGGRIINIGSLGGIRPWVDHAHYCASKAALHMLTLAMAKAFAPAVAVNCVAPGWIDLGESETRSAAKRFAAKTPMQKNGSGKDVAQAVAFFATTTTFITGQILTVDGGLGL